MNSDACYTQLLGGQLLSMRFGQIRGSIPQTSVYFAVCELILPEYVSIEITFPGRADDDVCSR